MTEIVDLDRVHQRWWLATEDRVLHSVAEYLTDDTARATCGALVARVSVAPAEGVVVRWCAQCLHAGGWLTADLSLVDTDTATVRDVALSILTRLPISMEEPHFEVSERARREVGPWFAATADPACSTAASQDVRELYDEVTDWYLRLETVVYDLRHGQGEHTETARLYLRAAVAGVEHLLMLGLDTGGACLDRRAPADVVQELYHRHARGEWETPAP